MMIEGDEVEMIAKSALSFVEEMSPMFPNSCIETITVTKHDILDDNCIVLNGVTRPPCPELWKSFTDCFPPKCSAEEKQSEEVVVMEEEVPNTHGHDDAEVSEDIYYSLGPMVKRPRCDHSAAECTENKASSLEVASALSEQSNESHLEHPNEAKETIMTLSVEMEVDVEEACCVPVVWHPKSIMKSSKSDRKRVVFSDTVTLVTQTYDEMDSFRLNQVEESINRLEYERDTPLRGENNGDDQFSTMEADDYLTYGQTVDEGVLEDTYVTSTTKLAPRDLVASFDDAAFEVKKNLFPTDLGPEHNCSPGTMHPDPAEDISGSHDLVHRQAVPAVADSFKETSVDHNQQSNNFDFQYSQDFYTTDSQLFSGFDSAEKPKESGDVPEVALSATTSMPSSSANPMAAADDPLKLASWPPVIWTRTKSILPPPHLIRTSSQGVIVYLVQKNLRFTDNLALHSAMWLSQSLQLPLVALALLEKETVQDLHELRLRQHAERDAVRNNNAYTHNMQTPSLSNKQSNKSFVIVTPHVSTHSASNVYPYQQSPKDSSDAFGHVVPLPSTAKSSLLRKSALRLQGLLGLRDSLEALQVPLLLFSCGESAAKPAAVAHDRKHYSAKARALQQLLRPKEVNYNRQSEDTSSSSLLSAPFVSAVFTDDFAHPLTSQTLSLLHAPSSSMSDVLPAPLPIFCVDSSSIVCPNPSLPINSTQTTSTLHQRQSDYMSMSRTDFHDLVQTMQLVQQEQDMMTIGGNTSNDWDFLVSEFISMEAQRQVQRSLTFWTSPAHFQSLPRVFPLHDIQQNDGVHSCVRLVSWEDMRAGLVSFAHHYQQKMSPQSLFQPQNVDSHHYQPVNHKRSHDEMLNTPSGTSYSSNRVVLVTPAMDSPTGTMAQSIETVLPYSHATVAQCWQQLTAQSDQICSEASASFDEQGLVDFLVSAYHLGLLSPRDLLSHYQPPSANVSSSVGGKKDHDRVLRSVQLVIQRVLYAEYASLAIYNSNSATVQMISSQPVISWFAALPARTLLFYLHDEEKGNAMSSSSVTLHHLRRLVEPVKIQPKQLRVGNTPSAAFNRLHRRLIDNGGVLLVPEMFFWLLVLLLQMPTVEMALNIAFKEYATHSVAYFEEQLGPPAEFLQLLIDLEDTVGIMMEKWRHEQLQQQPPTKLSLDTFEKLLLNGLV